MTIRPGTRLLEQRSVFRATAINHISYRVTDYARTRDFFVGLFGMGIALDDGNECVLVFGNPLRAIRISRGELRDGRPVIDHLGFSISGFDLASTADTLRAFGLEPEPNGDHGWTIADPDGSKIQICAEERPSGQGPNLSHGLFEATAVNHVACKVADYARTRDFFVDLFGMRLAFEDGRTCSVAFGDPEDAIYIARNPDPEAEAFVDHLAISVCDFDLEVARRRLEDRGFSPEPDGAHAWTIVDPDGFRIQVCAESGVYPGAARDPFHDLG